MSMTLKVHYPNIFFEKFAFKSIQSHIKSLALWKNESLGSDPKLDPKLLLVGSGSGSVTIFFGSGSKTQRKIGSRSGSRSEKNSYGSTTLLKSNVICSVVDPNSFYSDSDPQIIFFEFGYGFGYGFGFLE
jgi:hypothetical protein